MAVPMCLSKIIISEINNQQLIYLREIEGEREFFIVIGLFEATCIDRHIKDIPTQRPLTHDLICRIFQTTGIEPLDVTISRLEDQTFYATLRVRNGDHIFEIDARPSDAIAIAVSCRPHLPLYAEEEVINQAISQ